MESAFTIAHYILVLVYLGATYLYGRYFFSREKWAEMWMSRVLVVAVGLHISEVTVRGLHTGFFPMTNLSGALSMLVLSMGLIYLYTELRRETKTAGYFVLIVATVIMLFSALFFHLDRNIIPVFQRPVFIMHTSLAVLGYASLVVSAIFSLMYLLLYYDLKGNRFGLLYSRLPSLEEMHSMNLRAAVAGFFFLTWAILLGMCLAFSIYPEPKMPGVKGYFAVGIWLVYGSQLVGSKFFRWSGKRLAYISLGGFTILILSIAGLAWFLQNFHQIHQ